MNAGQGDITTLTEPLIAVFNHYVVPVMLAIASAVFVALAIINGIHMAKASTDEEKTKAKKALFGLLVGVIITVAGIWLIPELLDFLVGDFGIGDDTISNVIS